MTVHLTRAQVDALTQEITGQLVALIAEQRACPTCGSDGTQPAHP